MPVKDINPTGDSFPQNPGVLGDIALFSATDGDTGFELWRSDGTGPGTRLVRDIEPGDGSSSPFPIVPAGPIAFFGAHTSAKGTELWRTDGTRAGTRMVADINPDAADSDPFGLHARRQRDLLRRQRRHSRIRAVAQRRHGGGHPDGQGHQPHAPTRFAQGFRRRRQRPCTSKPTTARHGIELWRSDGTRAGTRMVADIWPANNSSLPLELTNFNGTRVLQRRRTVSTASSCGGATARSGGTRMVRDIALLGGDSSPTELTPMDDDAVLPGARIPTARSSGAPTATRVGTTAGARHPAEGPAARCRSS